MTPDALATIRFAVRAVVRTVLLALIVVVPAGAQSPTTEIIHRFTVSVPYGPTGLVRTENGMFYVTLASGGPTGYGALVRMTADGVITPLHYFDNQSDGGAPQSLISASDGFLYGIAGLRTIFKASRTGEITVLANVAPGTPKGDLLLASDGNLYGATGDGVIFRVTPAGGYTEIRRFTSTEPGGSSTQGSRLSPPMQASNGLLYFFVDNRLCGMALDGTIRFVGTSPADGIDTNFISQRLTQGRDGLLYGTQSGVQRSGIAFRATLDGDVTVFHRFPTPYSSNGALLAADDGNLYGTDEQGIIRVTPAGGVTTVTFISTDAYSTTSDFLYSGGSTFIALIGSRVIAGDTTGALRVIRRFEGGPEPTEPLSLVQGGDGYVYGLTARSGVLGGGTVFRMTPDGSVEVIKRLELSGTGNLVMAPDGVLFGAMSSWNDLTLKLETRLFRLAPNGLFATFDLGDVSGPRSLAIGAAGDLFFVTDRSTCGTIEKLSSSGQLSVVKTLTESAEGCAPDALLRSPIVLAADGQVYGTTTRALFRIEPDDRFVVVRTAPVFGFGSLTAAPDGSLYGIGPPNCRPSTFRVSPATGTLSEVQTAFTDLCGSFSLSPGPNGFYAASNVVSQRLLHLGYDGTLRVTALPAVAGYSSFFGLLWTGGTTFFDLTTQNRGAVRRITLPPVIRAAVGDFNGDRRTDLTILRPSSSTWFTPLGSFQAGEAGDVPLLGDFDGDGLTDAAAYHPTTGQWTVTYTSSAKSPRTITFQWGTPGDLPLAGYFDGDVIADAAVYRPSTGQWFIRYSSTLYTAGQFGYFAWGVPGDLPMVADFDGDGSADITVYRQSTGQWFIRYSSRAYAFDQFGYFQWGLAGDIPLTGDFDGDGKADLAVYRPGNGTWYIRQSSNGYAEGTGSLQLQFGLSDDDPFLADFDGDGRSDLALHRRSTNQWFIRYSSRSYGAAFEGSVTTGAAGDVAVLGSRQSIPAPLNLSAQRTGAASVVLSWQASAGATGYTIKRGTTPQTLTTVASGLSTNTYGETVATRGRYYYSVSATYGSVTSLDSNPVPVVFRMTVPATDVNGDGLSDLVLYGAGSGGDWTYNTATAVPRVFGGFEPLVAWGAADDVPLTTDFDGDGKLDPAVYHADSVAGVGQFMARLSSQSYAYAYFRQLGRPGDVPIPSDYDGDGKTDAAVYRPETGEWFLDGGTTFAWGVQGDSPVPGDFDGDGRTDLAVFRHATGGWFIRFSGAGYALAQAGSLVWGSLGDHPLAADFDGDGITDVAVYRPTARVFYIRRSSTGATLGIDMSANVLVDAEPVIGDFDGDEHADVILRVRGSSSISWNARLSTRGYASETYGDPYYSRSFGLITQVALPQAIAAVLPPSGLTGKQTAANTITLTWNARRGARSYTVKRGATSDALTTIATGVATPQFIDTVPGVGAYFYAVTAVYGFSESAPSAPLAARALPRAVPNTDVDGDGISDVMVYRPSTGEWLFRNSSTGFGIGLGTWRLLLGTPSDAPVRADVDGDGKLDPIVLRVESNGDRTFIGLRSSLNYQMSVIGTIRRSVSNVPAPSETDVPVGADVDGDGKSDLGVYSRTTGRWTFLLSSNNYTTGSGPYRTFVWGASGDEPVVCDFDGDTQSDIGVFRPRTGQWLLLYSSRLYSTLADSPAIFQLGRVGDRPIPADFDGDGRTDLVIYRPSTGEWFITYSSAEFAAGSGAPAFQWRVPGDEPIVDDLDGDARADAVVFRPSTGQWFVLYSSRGYEPALAGSYGWGLESDIALPTTPAPQIAAPIDLTAMRTGARTVSLTWAPSPGALGYVVKRRPASGPYTTIASGITTAAFSDTAPRSIPYYYTVAATYDVGTGVDAPEVKVVFPQAVPNSDMDGDGISDLIVYRPSAGYWYIRNSDSGYVIGGGPVFFNWGQAGAVPVPGDYDGDGKLDVTFETPSAAWRGLLSSTGYIANSLQVNLAGDYLTPRAGDRPLVGDFNGDGISDAVIYRPGTGEWFVGTVPHNSDILTRYQWGASSDVPIVGDFDGDGAADLTVFRPSTGQWFIRFSANGYQRLIPGVYSLGASGDTPVPADYDGDGITDLAVYRASTGQWFVRYSSLGFTRAATDLTVQWGLAGDEPRVGDFDGDGKADIVARRSSTGQMFILYSSRNYDASRFGYYEWGNAADIALP